MKKLLMLLALLCLCSCALADEEIYIEDTITIGGVADEGYIIDDVILTDEGEEIELTEAQDEALDPIARNDFIDRIIALGEELYDKANGRSQRAHYSSDIYVCKNFTTYLFRKNRDDFCMAEYPGEQLVIPNNLPSKECKPYSYGLAWEEIPASDGNPFYEAASFRYDNDLSYEENLELAMDFMRQAQRGDFFQMSAKYEYGTGAHSAIMLSYDPVSDEIHWMDSNMRDGKRDGIRYGLVQYDEVRSVQWWAEAFCVKTRGATLYRLRNDIVYREEYQ